jgi:polysaccharide export outer membrane protein
VRSELIFSAIALSLLVPAPALGQQPQDAAPAQATVPAISSYRINAGDELEIYVWGEERLQRQVKVLPDGTIAVPLVGQVMARGLLPEELELVLSKRLESQYRGQVPQVTVSVVAPTGMQFSVMGRVNAPGTFTPGRYVNVLEALSMAGGPNEFAKLDDVLIIRKSDAGLQTFRVRIGSVFKGGGNLDDSRALTSIVSIQPGDTVIVP